MVESCAVLSHFSCVQLFVTPWTVAPLSMQFSIQEYWSGLSFLSPGDFPIPGIEPRSPALQADSLLSEPQGNHGVLIRQSFPSKPPTHNYHTIQEVSWGMLCLHGRSPAEWCAEGENKWNA